MIAKGAPTKANTGAAHGAPLGEKEVAATRAALGWQYPPFEIPQRVYEGWDARKRGAAAERRWKKLFAAYEAAVPGGGRGIPPPHGGRAAARFRARARRSSCRTSNAKAETIATRKASQNVLEALVPALPELIGGSADLTGSNLTMVKASKVIGREDGGNYVFYGVREFGMCAVMNGIALHGGFIPYGGTFLVFSDYARNALRLAALIGAARDLRVHARLDRPGRGRADAPAGRARREPAADTQHGPVAAVRHGRDRGRVDRGHRARGRADGAAPHAPERAVLKRDAAHARGHRARRLRARGQRDGAPRAVIIATGSEVALALAAQEQLAGEGVPVRVVSMPSTSVFDRQDAGLPRRRCCRAACRGSRWKRA